VALVESGAFSVFLLAKSLWALLTLVRFGLATRSSVQDTLSKGRAIRLEGVGEGLQLAEVDGR
jgi:hypothetical protein